MTCNRHGLLNLLEIVRNLFEGIMNKYQESGDLWPLNKWSREREKAINSLFSMSINECINVFAYIWVICLLSALEAAERNQQWNLSRNIASIRLSSTERLLKYNGKIIKWKIWIWILRVHIVCMCLFNNVMCLSART